MSFKDLLRDSLMEDAKDDLKTRLVGNGFPAHMFNHLYNNALPHATKKIADMEWLANQHMRGGIGGQDLPDVTTIQHKLTEFHKPVIKAKLQKKNLNQYKDWDEFNSAIEPHVGTAPSKNEMKNDTKVLLQTDTHIVRQHGSQESMEAAAHLPKENPYHDELSGKANWCVSVGGEDGRNHFNAYTENGTHKFYTIEHTANHPTDPNRKFAVLADHNRDRDSAEVKTENQKGSFDYEPYIVSPHNKEVMNTPAGKYISHVSGHLGGNMFRKHTTFNTEEYSVNEKGQRHGTYNSFPKKDERGIFDKNGYFTTGEYTNGKESGNWHTKSIHHKGIIETHKTYHENGLMTEKNTMNGIPVFENTYKGNSHGKKVGVQKEYHENGKLATIQERDMEGGLTGESKTFHYNGALSTHIVYRPGGRGDVLRMKSYSDEGTLVSTHDHEAGTGAVYQPNGNLILHYHKNSEGNGVVTHYNPEGKKFLEETRNGGHGGSPIDSTHYNVHNGTKMRKDYHDYEGKVKESHHYGTDGKIYRSEFNDIAPGLKKDVSYHPNGKERSVSYIRKNKFGDIDQVVNKEYDEEGKFVKGLDSNGNKLTESVSKSSMFRRMIER